MTNSLFELGAFFCQLILLLDWSLHILHMWLDWKVSGLEEISHLKESAFQAMTFQLIVHSTSLVGRKIERVPEMRECHIQRHPEEIPWEEDDGQISWLQLTYCEYHLSRLGKIFIFVHALIMWHLQYIIPYLKVRARLPVCPWLSK